MRPHALNHDLQKYVSDRIAEFPQIPESRRRQLQELSRFVREKMAANEPAQFIFICTHNSRRSHFAQVWGAVAAEFYGLDGIKTFSGGTEATAFNPRSVAALRRAGFRIPDPEQVENPHYQVQFQERGLALNCFSKRYGDPANPQQDFCAVMTCSDADENCPIVPGAAARISLPFDDPKAFDNTPEETAKYDERCRQIAREILYSLSQVRE